MLKESGYTSFQDYKIPPYLASTVLFWVKLHSWGLADCLTPALAELGCYPQHSAWLGECL